MNTPALPTWFAVLTNVRKESLVNQYLRRQDFDTLFLHFSAVVKHAMRTGRPGALQTGLARLKAQNRAKLSPNHWYSAYHYSPPTLLARMAAIDRLAAAPASA